MDSTPSTLDFVRSADSSTFGIQHNSSVIENKIHIVTYVVSIDVLVAFGVIGNIMNIILATSSSLLGHSFSVYIICLAVSDSVVLINIAVEDTMDHIYGTLHQMLTYDLSFCKFWDFMTNTALVTSPWLLMALTIDRYVNIVHPRLRLRFCRVRISLIICSLVCSVAVVLTIPLITALQINKVDNVSSCDDDNPTKLYGIFFTIVMASTLPVGITFALNVRISISIYHWLKTDPSLNERKARRLTFSLVLVSVLSTLTLMPFSIIEVLALIKQIHRPDIDNVDLSNAWMTSNVIRIIDYGMNFYLLILFSEYYRDALISRIRSCGLCRTICEGRSPPEDPDERSGFSISGDPLPDTAFTDEGNHLHSPIGDTGDVVVASLRGLEDPEYLLLKGSDGVTQLTPITNVNVS